MFSQILLHLSYTWIILELHLLLSLTLISHYCKIQDFDESFYRSKYKLMSCFFINCEIIQQEACSSLHLQAVNSVSVARRNWSYKNYLYLFHKLYLMFCILECGLNSECFSLCYRVPHCGVWVRFHCCQEVDKWNVGKVKVTV